MANRIPINPSVLKWARETSGYTLSEVAKTARFSKLDKWESGEENPTYSQLEELAKKYHRPLAVFFFPYPPQEETIEKSLRASSEENLRMIAPNVRFLFRKARAFQINLKELHQDKYDVQRQKLAWLRVVRDVSIQKMAERVRKSLGISLDQQKSWQNSSEALRNWRLALAKNGIFVFKGAFKDDKISGFCIFDELFPVIFINNSLSKNRQIFTVFHEVAHLIFRESYLDVLDEDTFLDQEITNPTHEEAKCNAFSANFLVPISDFQLRIKEVNVNNDKDIHKLAEMYHVSQEVIMRRLLSQDIVSQSAYHRRIQKWHEQFENSSKSKPKGGGDYYKTQVAYLGESYISVVLRSYYQRQIDIDEASAYLDIKSEKFSKFEEIFMK